MTNTLLFLLSTHITVPSRLCINAEEYIVLDTFRGDSKDSAIRQRSSMQRGGRVKSAGAENRTVTELKKKWSDIKVVVKRRVAAHHLHVSSTGGGTELPELTPFEQPVPAIIGDTLIVGIVPAGEEDSDITTGANNSTKADPNEEDMVPGDDGAASVPTTSSGTGCSHTPATETGGRSSGHVLTDAVLESQNALVDAVRDVANELRNIKAILYDISEKIN
ncbi:uncharacterized protein LOC127529717 [Erpetoichthys calabaricus]|uniref:uncharacterized protein LOC127529717 n=1 Tax=Erpetoichthys calabaricus TaxID=27687 RepID=UPI0022343776|nr:uncharacterized protein LOC127529717 [Erpetoichthys calabaricus]